MDATNVPTITGQCTIGDYYPWVGGYSQPSVYYYHATVPPTECSGDVHVFPCPHCEKCKCGNATVKRDKRGKDGR